MDIRLDRLPRPVIEAYMAFPQRNEFVPVAVNNELLTVYSLKEQALPMADYLAWMMGMQIRSVLVGEEEFFPLLEQAMTLWEDAQEEQEDETELPENIDGQELLGWSHEDAPIVRLVNKTLQDAINKGASDVHFEGQGARFLVRFRLDGELYPYKQLNKALQPTIVARIKVMGEMDVAESRTPQDGRIRVRLANKDVDIRVSTVPTLNGEKAVLRILDRSKTILSLPDLGMEPDDLTVLRAATSSPHGIVLVTGPTGSGKTTTLYAALSELVRDARNIMTVEDPVEYHLAGVNQVQVNRSAGVTFASSIRAFLRQDPDIILVGEIRDNETASTAIQASLTGHLVLSTLHTNDAPTAIARLLEMELEPFLVASSLTLAMGQRLVRVVCPHCGREVPVPETTRRLLGANGESLTTQRMGRGCEQCFGTGFKGRRGIFELMPMDEELRSMIISKAPVDEYHAYRKRHGLTTMWSHGMRLVAQGVTTCEEVLRVTRL